MMTGHGVERPSLTGSCAIETMSVYISLDRISNNGHMKSFHRAMKEIVAQAARAGEMTGKAICQ